MDLKIFDDFLTKEDLCVVENIKLPFTEFNQLQILKV
tara:strand:+ start:374 stop:484 length:111 start_codon:yes stop_codon:yes gene_type:complete